MERKQYEDCIANLTQSIQTLLNENVVLEEKQKVTLQHQDENNKKITELETQLEKLRKELRF